MITTRLNEVLGELKVQLHLRFQDFAEEMSKKKCGKSNLQERKKEMQKDRKEIECMCL